MTLEGLKKPNFDPNLPIYLQIMNFVKKLIVRGVLKPGDKVPSVRDMALFLGVNPNTVQKAYEELERDGTIFTKRGQGNFVNEDKSVAVKLKEAMVKEVIERYKKEMEELGISKEQILILLKEMLE
ncbi:MAG: GntR family transcriptional regulator [bacterium]|nr:GntR family transcriptional regulator [bacterium]